MKSLSRVWEVFTTFLYLGLTSFGGPIAHLGYFHNEIVVRRNWLTNKAFTDTVALCQFLPGPTSSQVGIVIGLHRGGRLGALAAWLGFTMPSVIVLICFATGMPLMTTDTHVNLGWLVGLRLAAVVVVAQAVQSMARSFCTERSTATLASLSAVLLLVIPSAYTQLVCLIMGATFGALGYRLFPDHFLLPTPPRTSRNGHGAVHNEDRIDIPFGTKTGAVHLVLFFVFLIGLPILATSTGSRLWQSFTAFYWTGSLVFGGGHVVLPILNQAVVQPGWVSHSDFLTGYGMAQAVSGPLFSFAAFLGTVMDGGSHGWLYGLWCLAGIYLPSLFLVFGSLPFWENLRHKLWLQASLRGTNASVVGILIAALYTPIWTETVRTPVHVAIIFFAYVLLNVWKLPPWSIVLFCALAGMQIPSALPEPK